MRQISRVLLSIVALALAAEATYRAVLYLRALRAADESTFELYALGESTMVGEPFHPKISVPRLLQHAFGGSIAGRPIKVVQLAERGVPLYPQAAAFQRAIESHQAGAPGVVLIMSGHNETFTSHPGTTQPFAPSIIADRSAVVRDLLLMLRRKRLVGRDRTPAAYEYYLRHVIETALANGLVPILTTMASNISRIEPNVDPSTAEALVAIVDQGRALENAGKYAEARALYRSHLTDTPGPASLHYRIGRCEEALGNFAAAREQYWAAIERDPRLLFGRATRTQNDFLRAIAHEYRVPLVDGVEILERQSPHGILGPDLFMDGQHPTIRGYVLLADAYAQILSELFDTPIAHPLHDEADAIAALGFGRQDASAAAIISGSWLIATAVNHPFPHDRMALARARFAAARGAGDDFSAWFGIALAQAARGGMLRDPDAIRALGGSLGFVPAYAVRAGDWPPMLKRFEAFGVEPEVIEHLKTSWRSS